MKNSMDDPVEKGTPIGKGPKERASTMLTLLLADPVLYARLEAEELDICPIKFE